MGSHPLGERPGRGDGRPLNLATPILALCSALCWGIGDFSGGFASRFGHVIVTLVAAQGIGLIPTVLLVAMSAEPLPQMLALVWAGIAGASGVLGIGFFYLALSRGTMGLVAPLTALIGGAIPATVGLLNGDPATPLLICGLVMALASVVLISLPEAADTAHEAAGHQPGRWRELAIIAVAGLGFAGFFLGIDQSHLAGGETYWPLLLVRAVGLPIALGCVVVVVLRGRGEELRVRRRVLPVLVLAGLGDLGGNLFFILANQSGPLAVAVVLSSLYPVTTAILARIILHERLSRLRLAGVGAAIVGIVLIALG